MKVIAFKRELQGSGASRRLRISGQTPGIVYGGAEAPVLISLDHNALYHALKKEVFHSSILDLEIDGVSQQVLLRDFQVHAYKQLVLHADFQRVDAKQAIHVKVALQFINVDLSNIDVGHSLHVGDLVLPAGVTVVAHGDNLTIATASVPAGHVAAEAEAAAAEADKK